MFERKPPNLLSFMQGIRGERGVTGVQGYPGRMVYCLELFQIIHIVLSRDLPIFLIVHFS